MIELRKAFLFALITISVQAFIFNICLTTAENFGSQIIVNPSDPSETDSVNVLVIFQFHTQPSYVANFSSTVRRGNVFSANVTVYTPRKDEYVLEMVHTDNFTYHLGKLSAGHYVFKLFVKTFHGSERQWFEEKEFDVKAAGSGIATLPEFPPTAFIASTIMLAIITLALKTLLQHEQRIRGNKHASR